MCLFYVISYFSIIYEVHNLQHVDTYIKNEVR